MLCIAILIPFVAANSKWKPSDRCSLAFPPLTPPMHAMQTVITVVAVITVRVQPQTAPSILSCRVTAARPAEAEEGRSAVCLGAQTTLAPADCQCVARERATTATGMAGGYARARNHLAHLAWGRVTRADRHGGTSL